MLYLGVSLLQLLISGEGIFKFLFGFCRLQVCLSVGCIIVLMR